MKKILKPAWKKKTWQDDLQWYRIIDGDYYRSQLERIKQHQEQKQNPVSQSTSIDSSITAEEKQ